MTDEEIHTLLCCLIISSQRAPDSHPGGRGVFSAALTELLSPVPPSCPEAGLHRAHRQLTQGVKAQCLAHGTAYRGLKGKACFAITVLIMTLCLGSGRDGIIPFSTLPSTGDWVGNLGPALPPEMKAPEGLGDNQADGTARHSLTVSECLT